MGSLFATLIGGIPNLLLSIIAKMVTKAVLQQVVEKVVIHGLRHAVKLTTNTLDDEAAELMIKQLQAPPPDEHEAGA